MKLTLNNYFLSFLPFIALISEWQFVQQDKTKKLSFSLLSLRGSSWNYSHSRALCWILEAFPGVSEVPSEGPTCRTGERPTVPQRHLWQSLHRPQASKVSVCFSSTLKMKSHKSPPLLLTYLSDWILHTNISFSQQCGLMWSCDSLSQSPLQWHNYVFSFLSQSS